MASILLPLALGLAGALLMPKPKDQYGPRISDINIGNVSPGNPVIRHWGTMKLPAQLLWTSKLIETQHEQSVGGKGGGKGGLGGGGKYYYYTYAVDCAFAVCLGPVYRINRIWANQKLLWMHEDVQAQAQADFDAAYYAELDRLVNQEYVTDIDEAYCGAFIFAFNNYRPDEYTYGTVDEAASYIMSHIGSGLNPPVGSPSPSRVHSLMSQMLDGLGHDQNYAKNKIRFDWMNLYLGSETQIPNAKMEEYLGVGNVPAYRGVVYFVMYNLQLEDFGNGIPTMTAEVQKTESGQTFLHEIVGGICTECGLTPDDMSLGSLPGHIAIPGYAITQTVSGRAAINSLQQVFPFDAAESGYKAVFNWINTRPVAVLRREDFGAWAEENEPPAPDEITRAMDADLPKRLNLKFQEPVRAYSANTVHAIRTVTDSTAIDTIDCTIALTRAQAKTQIEEMLGVRFLARKTHRLFLPRKYVIIEPGDAVLVPDDTYPEGSGVYLTWRCQSVDIAPNGMMEAVFADHNQWVSAEAPTEDDLSIKDNAAQTLAKASPTVPYLLDIPLLTDSETGNVGFYAMLAGNNSQWPGGILYLDISSGNLVELYGTSQQAPSSGSNWYAVAQSVAQVAHGYALTALPDAMPGLWDSRPIRVYLRNRDISLVAATRDDIIANPFNVALIGNEIIQFAKARDLGNGIWELSDLLRGLRGTEQETGSHVAGERFVRLTYSAVTRVTHAQASLNRAGTYRALTSGDASDTASSFEFANTGNSLRPYAPALYEAVRRDTGDIYMRWSPRVRQNGGLLSGQETLLDQDSESYEIDVLQGGTAVRTVQLTAREWTYTAATQASDFGSMQASVVFKLYQIGRIVGRGFAQTVEA